MTPCASISASSPTFRAKATGVRSISSMRRRFGRMRCTLADSTQGICSDLNDAMRVNQRQFADVPGKGDGSALHQLDAKAIREDALHAGGFDPGNLFRSE